MPRGNRLSSYEGSETIAKNFAVVRILHDGDGLLDVLFCHPLFQRIFDRLLQIHIERKNEIVPRHGGVLLAAR